MKRIGTLDMYAQTAVQLSTTDQQIATALDPFCSAVAVPAKLTRLVNSQEHGNILNYQRV